MAAVDYVSVHGGHSGQFCDHATDSLEEIILAYIAKGFVWVGITEHAPAVSEDLLYQDQREEGLTPELLFAKFGEYMKECRRLQQKYSSQITIFAGIEIETYTGYDTFVPHLIDCFSPDYLVGSVHFVNDINFDYSTEMYDRAVASVGGINSLYEEYFDTQFEMIKVIRPSVVGHFDLIRIFDPDYQARLRKPAINAKVKRNLELIKDLGLILDFNLRSLAKGAREPYITGSILELVRSYEIAVVPGDDSHSVDSVGNFIAEAVTILQDRGFSTEWQTPSI